MDMCLSDFQTVVLDNVKAAQGVQNVQQARTENMTTYKVEAIF